MSWRLWLYSQQIKVFHEQAIIYMDVDLFERYGICTCSMDKKGFGMASKYLIR